MRKYKVLSNWFNLNHSTSRNNYNFNKYSLPAVLFNNLYDGSLTLQMLTGHKMYFQMNWKGVEHLTEKYFQEMQDYFLMEGKKFLMLLRVVYSHSKPQIYILMISKEPSASASTIENVSGIT